MIENLQQEYNQMRLELTRALDAESDMKLHEEKRRKEVTDLQTEIETLRVANVKLEEACSLLQKRLQSRNVSENEANTQSESQRIQLQLLKTENEDKVQEVERIRAKMIQALRMATDNHNAHLRIVEERHRSVVEELQNINRTLELEGMKLRTQLARLDPANPSNIHINAALNMQSTTELLDAQTRQSQEIELKRLYAELSALQVQRDEAVLRYEQHTLNLRRDSEVQLQESRRDKQILQRKLDEYRGRCDKLEQLKIDSEGQIQPLRDRLQTTQNEVEKLRSENASLLQKKDELLRKISESEISLSEAKEQEQISLSAERKRADMLEQRVEEVLKSLQEAKDRACNESQLAIRQKDILHGQLQEANQRIILLENQLGREQRESRAAQSQLERINKALLLHKDQIRNYETRWGALQKDLEVYKQRERNHLLQVEQLKVENNRIARTQSRLLGGY
ncbi:hypothetical protein AGDE_11847 [Angomonas deanei]|nr:hypothetical protein AGDE_11847 [Angomonas deanei]|eukprot:EPY25360.1 hypothetical protein AGDE_11847 [Angomonas deanei]